MSKLNRSILFFTLFSTPIIAQTEKETKHFQNPPIIMEAMIGSRGVMHQLIVNKKFSSIPQLGFFSVTYGTATWEKEISPGIMTQAHLTYSLIKGLDVSLGMQYSPVNRFRPVAGLVYSYTTPKLLIVLNPKFDLVDDYASQNLAIFEYKPKLNDNLNFYTRFQGLYGFVPESGNHSRSYIMLRAGLNYKEFSFGAASNFDWYGPRKQNENSFGLFINALLF